MHRFFKNPFIQAISDAMGWGFSKLFFPMYSLDIFMAHICKRKWQWCFEWQWAKPTLDITHWHRAPNRGQLIPRQIAEDSGMSQIRMSVEWPYKMVTNLFHMLHSKCNNHFLRCNQTVNDIIHKQLRVVFFLYNCLNGSKFAVSLMFSLLV